MDVDEIEVGVAAAAPALAMLARQRLLLGITLVVQAAGTYEVTVSKPVDGAGRPVAEYWWEVDKLAGDGLWERRWAAGMRPCRTPEAAYREALRQVEGHLPASQ